MSESACPSPALPVLDAVQARVLGCLIEKEATTPDVYPLTVNAAQVAANQKTAREPLMSLETGETHRALRQLGELGLVRQQFSSRAERYEHRLEEALGLPRQQTVLLGLLLLRGAQTAHELFARSERLLRFADAEEIGHHLERLQRRGLVQLLPRAPGQREPRWVHLLCGPVDPQAFAATPAASTEVATDAALAERVAQLEDSVAQLRSELDALRAALQRED